MAASRPLPKTSDDVRQLFIDFFAERDHRNMPSSSLVPFNDPTVLLTTAGVQQFVPYMLGRETPPHRRLTSVQKCFRTTDIDQVGNPRNLTFFEMLGNFSIGDYFKAEIIPWSWELVTQWLHFPPDRVLITIHPSDDEALQIWLDTGIPRERISFLEDNWWGPPGAEGPCGPDSELYYDRGPEFGCGRQECAPGCECDRYLEFWNLVFTQFYQDRAGNRTPLAQMNIDTGMGLERTTAIVQGVNSVYETDAFRPVLDAVAALAHTSFGMDKTADYALRVVADHCRGMTFLIADGVLPGAEGRSYVLRRIIRRAVRYGRRLGIEDRFLSRVADVVIERMRARYPELDQKRALIHDTIEVEEARFLETLASGSARLADWIDEARRSGATTVSGRLLFQLYDTYGFPYELSAEILAESGLQPDLEGFEAALSEQRERSRAGATFGAPAAARGADTPNLPQTEFLGYHTLEAQGSVLGVRENGSQPNELRDGQRGSLILDRTPFYPEGGGQIGDRGEIRGPDWLFRVEDCQTDGAGRTLHQGVVVEGAVQVGETAAAFVDAGRRTGTTAHHTVTHILHRALKDVVGEQTEQRGSLVSPEVCRFDFNYPTPLNPDQLTQLTETINQRIVENLQVNWQIMDLDQARAAGAIMIFGEKYGQQVRLVRVGDYSKELCGGTHVQRSGDLGVAFIAREYGIGSGLRRVEVYTGRAAHTYAQRRLEQLQAVASAVGAQTEDQVLERVNQLLEQVDRLRRESARLERQLAGGRAEELISRAREVNGVKVIAAKVDVSGRDSARELADRIRERLPSGVIVLAGVQDDRPFFISAVTSDLIDRGVRADTIVSDISQLAGGKGGGRPDMAQGGGRDTQRIGPALDRVAAVVRELLGSR